MGTYDQNNDIFYQSYNIEISPNDILTSVRYKHAYNYGRKDWQSINLKTDSTKVSAYNKDYEEIFEMMWVRDNITAADVAERKLNFRKTLQTTVSFKTALHSLDDDILSDITVSHVYGPSLGSVTVTGLSINLDNLDVEISAIAVPTPVTFYLLLENGDKLLTESGDNFIKESQL